MKLFSHVTRTDVVVQAQLFPERDTVFSYFFQKRSTGNWIGWLEMEEKKREMQSDLDKVR